MTDAEWMYWLNRAAGEVTALCDGWADQLPPGALKAALNDLRQSVDDHLDVIVRVGPPEADVIAVAAAHRGARLNAN